MKLYELADEYRANVAKLQDLDMPPEAVLDTIDAMQGELSEKIKAVLIVAMELDGEAAVRLEHSKRMAESAKGMAGRADGLRSYAQIYMQNSGLVLPLKFPEFTAGIQRNPQTCTIKDVTLLPPHMKSTELSVAIAGSPTGEQVKALSDLFPTSAVTMNEKPDKAEVLKALKVVELSNTAKAAGEEPDRIPGAHLNPPCYRVTIK